jgi:hypothetical protein
MKNIFLVFICALLRTVSINADGMPDSVYNNMFLLDFFSGDEFSISDEVFHTSDGITLYLATNTYEDFKGVFTRAVVFEFQDDYLFPYLTLDGRTFRDKNQQIILDFSGSSSALRGFSGNFAYSERSGVLSGLQLYGEFFVAEQYQSEPFYIVWDPNISNFIELEVDRSRR